jgi:hypothetical protein
MGLPQTLTKRASIDAELTPTYPDVAHLLLDWRPLFARQNDKFGRHRRFVGAALEFVTSGRSVAISSDAVWAALRSRIDGVRHYHNSSEEETSAKPRVCRPRRETARVGKWQRSDVTFLLSLNLQPRVYSPRAVSRIMIRDQKICSSFKRFTTR